MRKTTENTEKYSVDPSQMEDNKKIKELKGKVSL